MSAYLKFFVQDYPGHLISGMCKLLAFLFFIAFLLTNVHLKKPCKKNLVVFIEILMTASLIGQSVIVINNSSLEQYV